MKIWMTGAKGLLGRAMIKACHGLDFVATGDVDITDLDAMKRFVERHTPTHLINCAAYTNVDGAESEPELAKAVNTYAVAQMGKLGVKVVHFSTDFVFDGQKNAPYTEEDEPNPLSVYGRTKLEGERQLLCYAPESCVIRISWLFDLEGPCFLTKMRQLIQSEKSVKVVTDQIGRPTFASDAASVCLQLMDQSGIWHFANKGIVSRYDWIKQAVGGPVEKAVSADFITPAVRPLYSALDTGKIETLGVKIRPWQECV
ncbi:MAG TPA: dTDP-4-dehydrorhamnose reductase [Chlamydiales bacterium]|nr:dTDP-4-dehydrorhamnose reductase [Chlamydiales bacterium]